MFHSPFAIVFKQIAGSGKIRKDFLLVDGDVVTNIDLRKLRASHRQTREKDKEAIMTMLLKQTLTSNPNGQMSTWSNPDKGFTVTQGPVATKGNCREFISKVTVGKELRNIKGTACLENNEWIMKEIYQ